MNLLHYLFPTLKISKVLNQANIVILAQSELTQAQSRFIASRCSDEKARNEIIETADKVVTESEILEELCQ